MKRNTLTILVSLTLMMFCNEACLNGDQMNLPPGAGGGSFVVMTYNTGINSANINSGLTPTYFSNSALIFSQPIDTANFAVTIQGPTLSKDLNITINIDQTKINDNYINDSLTYNLMPDTAYTFVSTTGVIKAGKTYAQFQLIINSSKLDGTQNYMLPLVSSNDANVPTADNYKTIYLHTIGNPIAGVYNQEWIRWNNSTGTGTPDFDLITPDVGPGIFAPVSGSEIQVESGTGVSYHITFSNNSGVLENFKASFNPDDVSNAGITISAGPSVTKADPISGQYEFTFGYVNSAGSPRVIIDKFQKQ